MFVYILITLHTHSVKQYIVYFEFIISRFVLLYCSFSYTRFLQCSYFLSSLIRFRTDCPSRSLFSLFFFFSLPFAHSLYRTIFTSLLVTVCLSGYVRVSPFPRTLIFFLLFFFSECLSFDMFLLLFFSPAMLLILVFSYSYKSCWWWWWWWL